jgi:dienelactone hydrolase
VKRSVRYASGSALVVLLLIFVATPYVDALALIARAAGMAGTVGEIGEWRARPIAAGGIEKIPTRHGDVDGRLYRPAEGSVRRSVTLVPGVHMDGIRETRLVALAQDLAEAGYEVLTVASPDLQRFMITPRNTDIIEDAAKWLAAREPDRQIGMLGISFSGGLSIVAAGRPELRDKVAFVMSFGGHGDLPRVMRYLCSGNVPPMPPLGEATADVAGAEHVAIHPPHDYGVAVGLLGLAEYGIVPADQVEPLRKGILTFLLASSLTLVDRAQAEAEFERARAYALTLPEPSRTYMTYVNDRAVDKLGPVLLPYVEQLSEASAAPALSPERAAAPAAPVFLLHGAEDNVIPSVETVLLANYLRGKTEVHAVLSGLITHAEVDKSAAAIEVWRLVGFWKDLMAQ